MGVSSLVFTKRKHLTLAYLPIPCQQSPSSRWPVRPGQGGEQRDSRVLDVQVAHQLQCKSSFQTTALRRVGGRVALRKPSITQGLFIFPLEGPRVSPVDKTLAHQDNMPSIDPVISCALRCLFASLAVSEALMDQQERQRRGPWSCASSIGAG